MQEPDSPSGINLQGASLSPVPPHVPRRIDSPPKRPDWATILLARVQRGSTIDSARKMRGSLVSTDTIQRFGALDPDWYLALMDAQEARASGSPIIDDLELARANAYEEEERRHELAMTASERYAHPYMRLGKETTGRIGAQGQGVAQAQQIVVNIQVVSATEVRARKRKAPSAHDEAPTGE